jgi:hypothetical protein
MADADILIEHPGGVDVAINLLPESTGHLAQGRARSRGLLSSLEDISVFANSQGVEDPPVVHGGKIDHQIIGLRVPKLPADLTRGAAVARGR